MAAAATEQSQEAISGEDGPDPEPLLSFREHMWDSFGKLWNERVEPSRKLLEDFTASIRDRIEVERVYATGFCNKEVMTRRGWPKRLWQLGSSFQETPAREESFSVWQGLCDNDARASNLRVI